MKFCVQCGAKLADDAKFCTSCGSSSPAAQENASKEPAKAPVQKVPAAPKPQPAPAVNAPEAKPKKKSKAPAVIAIVLVLLILIGAGIIAIPKLIGNIDFTASDDSSDKVSSDDNNADNEDQEEIDTILSDAEELAAEKDYEGALAEVQAGLEEYPKSEDLQKKVEEYTAALNAQIKETVLAEAADLADAGDYVGAMERIQSAQDTYGDDADYQKAYDTYNQTYIDEIKTEALETAKGFAKKKDYLSAYNTIAEAVEEIGKDADLTEKAAEYETAYVTDITTQADAFIKEGNISSAKELLQNAAKNFPNNASLKSYTEEMDKYKTVLLDSLTPINGGFTWNDGTPEDPFGNDYTEPQNYTILHNHNSYYEATHSAEYKTDSQYNLLTFTISPYSDFAQNCNAYLQVYADNSLRYTTPKVVQKTQPQTFSIDISNATYIKIVVKLDVGYSCVMLSDVMLSCVPNYVSSQSSGYTPLSTLDTFNGSITWDQDYPENIHGNDYSNVQNYHIWHSHSYYNNKSSTYSVEYYVNKQYTSLSFNIAPATDFNASSTSYVEVYLDDVLVYTSPEITQKTELFSTGDIDLSNATYLKIVIGTETSNACLILSDVLLKNK